MAIAGKEEGKRLHEPFLHLRGQFRRVRTAVCDADLTRPPNPPLKPASPAGAATSNRHAQQTLAASHRAIRDVYRQQETVLATAAADHVSNVTAREEHRQRSDGDARSTGTWPCIHSR